MKLPGRMVLLTSLLVVATVGGGVAIATRGEDPKPVTSTVQEEVITEVEPVVEPAPVAEPVAEPVKPVQPKPSSVPAPVPVIVPTPEENKVKANQQVTAYAISRGWDTEAQLANQWKCVEWHVNRVKDPTDLEDVLTVAYHYQVYKYNENCRRI